MNRTGYYATKAAAAYIGIKPTTLIAWRRKRRGPPPIRLSQNRCVYSIAEIDDWMRGRQGFEKTSGNTAEAPPAPSEDGATRSCAPGRAEGVEHKRKSEPCP